MASYRMWCSALLVHFVFVWSVFVSSVYLFLKVAHPGAPRDGAAIQGSGDWLSFHWRSWSTFWFVHSLLRGFVFLGLPRCLTFNWPCFLDLEFGMISSGDWILLVGLGSCSGIRLDALGTTGNLSRAGGHAGPYSFWVIS